MPVSILRVKSTPLALYVFIKSYRFLALHGCLLFLLVLLSETLNFGPLTAMEILLYFASIFGTLFVLSLLGQLSKSKALSALMPVPFSLVICLVTSLFIVYPLNFSEAITADVLFAVLQSNPREAIEFLGTFINSSWLFVVLATIILSLYLPIQQGKLCQTPHHSPQELHFKNPKWPPLQRKGHVALSLLLSIIIAGGSLLVLPRLPLIHFINTHVQEYLNELSTFRAHQKKRAAQTSTHFATKQDSGETYLVVIGESLNKNHMSLYGYHRNTTPKLLQHTQHDLLRFAHAYSSHTHTTQVLSMSLTEANQYNQKNYYESPSIVNIVKAAGFRSYWVSNQVTMGEWDNLVSVVAENADHVIRLNKLIGKHTRTTTQDASVIPEVKKLLENTGHQNTVIFVHLMGNHTHYCHRYPPQFKHFSAQITPAEFGAYTHDDGRVKSRRINCYDNSVRYNDFIVARLLALMQEVPGVTGWIYFADHADDVLRGLGHSSAKFTYAMTEIPLLMWFSKPYQKRYPGKMQSLLAHQREPFPNDLLYDTLIGVLDIKSEHYDSQADLSSNQYGPQQFLTLHGKKNYIDPSNRRYHQTINCQWLVQTQQTQRIFPHRINSIGKLNQILHDGFRSLELDLVFTKESNDRGHFAVGHGPQTMAGLTFDEYLNVINPISLDKIWLDVKNLQAENLDSMRNRLNFLEGKYHLKRQMIFESSTQNASFQILAADGYHTSYYLPTRSIIRLLEANEHSALVDEAERIAQQIATQHTQGVSFDHRLYPFVKTYLEPKLPMSLSYHLWDQQLKLWEPNLSIRLKDKAYYDDQRVKTILLPYWSHFNL